MVSDVDDSHSRRTKSPVGYQNLAVLITKNAKKITVFPLKNFLNSCLA